MLKNAETQFYATIEQTSSNINTEFENMAVMVSALIHDKTLMEESLEYCTADATVQNRYKASYELDKVLEKIFLTTNLKGSIYLVFNNTGKSVYVNRNYQTLSMNNTEVAALVESIPDTTDKVRCINRLYWERNISETRPVAIMVARPPVNRGYITGIYCIAVAFSSSSLYNFMYSSLARTGELQGELKYMVSSDGRILVSSDSVAEGKLWQLEKRRLGKQYLFIEQPVKTAGWTICSVIPVKAITGRVEIVTKAMTMFLALIILFFIIYNIYFFHAELKPLKNVIDSMGKVAQGNFSVCLPQYKFRELSSLSDSFNSMTEQLDVLTEQIKEEQQERLKTEIKALRFQLNPHFVCNTLNTIRMMAMMSKNEAITKMATSFMAIMEDNLRDDNMFNSLEHELKNLENYVYLMQVRYGKKFDYFCSISENLMNSAVPSMILQPLVENAIIHGIRGISRNGTITVSASLVKTDDFSREIKSTDMVLKIEVADNGCGMAQEKLDHIFEAEQDSRRGLNHVGIRAVYNRIRLLFGSPYTMQISSFPDEGTVVTIYIPASVFREDDEGHRYDTNSDR